MMQGEAAEDCLRADAPPPLAMSPGGATIPKAIIVFSDGTGNSSGKLFRTNVYRLYEAMDLGPSRDGVRPQIGRYDNGVGTSSFRPLAILGGILGLGLRRNVLSLYRFICRNYNPGDRIYVFGFSRGAFTARLLAALICAQGCVKFKDEGELKFASADAFYRFTDDNKPDVFSWFWRAAVALRQLVRRVKRRATPYLWHLRDSAPAEVEFLGVWDTVAAYGGPFSEVTRGIDKYVWPLTMTDYDLPVGVKAARHALALDDERESFAPLPWDEVAEARRAKAATTKTAREFYRSRLKQVWFAGAHADVGGGYPDESLSYVSLTWMIDEIAAAEASRPKEQRLRLLPDRQRAIRTTANPFGPIHDSRRGLASYYRYQPRKIAALLHKGAGDTLSFDQTRALRDPTIGEKATRPEGLLLGCRVHDSVIERIGHGNDGYAPIALPRDFDVVGPNAGTDGVAAAVQGLDQPGVRSARAERQEDAWDEVWHRRWGYYIVLGLTLLLLVTPWFFSTDPFRPETDARWPGDIVLSWFRPLVPQFAAPWFDAFQRLFFLYLAVLAGIALISARMGAQEARLRDAVRKGWWAAIGGQVAATSAASGLRAFRDGYPYQRGLQVLRWHLLPFVFGVGSLVAIAYLVFVTVSQTTLAYVESAQTCVAGSTAGRFDAAAPCQRLGHVEAGHRYRVVLTSPVAAGQPLPDLTDGGHRVRWGGQPSLAYAGPVKWLMLAATPLRRVVLGAWFEPTVKIVEQDDVVVQRFEAPRRLRRSTGDGRPVAWIGEFTAARSGEFALFLNDALLPRDVLGTYRNNRGTAEICVADAHVDPPEQCPYGAY